ncbi:MAG: metal ABC transporter permease [Planctomycetes bacterium]|nr:metal ABC transporter permease [Planctomycetota bacterium]
MLDTIVLFRDVILGVLLGGAGCSLVGFYLSNLRMPFMGVCLSHAAMAGAVLAMVFGLPVWPAAFGLAILSAFFVGPIADRTGMDVNVSMGIIFSLMMGIAFLGIGAMKGPRSEALGLIWGSVLFVREADLLWMAGAVAVTIVFVVVCDKELRAVLFSREVAASAGIRESLVFYTLLVLSGAMITTNLETVGGLMLFSLLVNPTAAAMRLTSRYGPALATTVAIGVLSASGGLVLSYLLGAPTGASIALVSFLFFAASVAIHRLRKNM